MAAPVLPPPLREGDRLTREEFLRRWEAMPDLKHAELIDGIVHMPSPVKLEHSDLHFRLGGWLSYYAARTIGCRGGTEGTWIMDGKNVPQPDLTLRILPEHGGQSRVEDDYPVGAPELALEVSLSSRSRDLAVKLRLYERSGVREYLTAIANSEQFVWRELVNGKYRAITPGRDGIFRCRHFPGLWLDAVALWAWDQGRLFDVLQQGIATPEHAEFVHKPAARKR